MSTLVQTNQPVVIVAAAAPAVFNVLASHSGKIILIPALGGAGVNVLTINLPVAAAGLHYRFLATATLASNAVITPAAITLVHGVLLNNAAAVAVTVVPKNGDNTVSMLAVAEVGTYIDVISTGTHWCVSGVSRVAAGLA